MGNEAGGDVPARYFSHAHAYWITRLMTSREEPFDEQARLPVPRFFAMYICSSAACISSSDVHSSSGPATVMVLSR